MPLTSLVLVLVAAVLHATWNILAKGVRGDGALFVWWYGLVSAVVFLPVSVVVSRASGWGWTLLGASVVSGLLHTLYGLALQTGYERAPLGIVYPVARATGPMLTMAVAVTALGEHLTTGAVAGAVLILIGVAVVATWGRPTSSNDGAAGASTSHGALAGVAWGVATGACIAGYTLWDGHSVTTLSLPPMTYFALTAAFTALSLTPTALRRRSRVAESWRLDRTRILAVGVLSPLAYVLVLYAMRTAPVALVAPLRESSIVVGSILAWLLYRENRVVPRLVGVLVALAGITLISVS